MSKSKIYKFIAVALLLIFLGGVAIYTTRSNRHQAIIKTTIAHKLGLVDNKWNVDQASGEYQMLSPTFVIDGIYKSMEGPKSSDYVRISANSDLVYLTGFHVKAYDAKTMARVSNDYICHTNVDFNDVNYYSHFGLEDRIGKQYPRMTSLSHGLEDFIFPTGYGVPMRGSDLLYVTTQSLNHNHKNPNLHVKHKVSIEYTTKPLKPLLSRTAFIMLPYDKYDPYKSPIDPGTDFCIPVETDNHSYDDGTGGKLSGHWVIPPGKNIYRSDVGNQLQITDSLRLHAAAIHVHPFATSISLMDKTTKTSIFTSDIENHNDRVGLKKVGQFLSENGIWLFKDRQYELVLTVDNTSNEDQDMMGSAFLFFYDDELEQNINKKSGD
ncbi:MAG: hypothetical protein IR153_04910 [Flavobacterium sp.]|nr:hypothetical protein [Flavobacterium sp.]